MLEYKICAKFKLKKICEKPTTELNKNSTRRDDLDYYCRICKNFMSPTWKKNNKDYWKKYRREKAANNEYFRLAQNLRNRLYKALIRQVTKKNSKTRELIGMSFEEFKKYIEFLMTPEMTWGNFHLDHSRPLSSFNLTDSDQLKEATHFSNIQPLLKQDNRKKNARYHEHDLAVQK